MDKTEIHKTWGAQSLPDSPFRPGQVFFNPPQELDEPLSGGDAGADPIPPELGADVRLLTRVAGHNNLEGVIQNMNTQKLSLFL